MQLRVAEACRMYWTCEQRSTCGYFQWEGPAEELASPGSDKEVAPYEGGCVSQYGSKSRYPVRVKEQGCARAGQGKEKVE